MDIEIISVAFSEEEDTTVSLYYRWAGDRDFFHLTDMSLRALEVFKEQKIRYL